MPKISKEQREARRRQILNAATTCFARKGFDATRVQDICQEAGLSPGAVYLYFDSKDAMVRALAKKARAASRAQWERITQDGGDSGLTRIEKLFDLACSESDPTARRLGVQFWAQAFDNDFLSEAMAVDHGKSVKRVAGLLRSEGTLTPADAKALSELILATLRGFGLQRAIVPKIDLKPAARAFLRALRSELARATATGSSSENPSEGGTTSRATPPEGKRERKS
jgi:AcrR family transcriptional regulator